MTIEDFLYVCKSLTKLGVDAIEVSGNWMARSKEKEAYFKNEAAMAAKENQVAVILTGGNRDCGQMEQLLNSTEIGYFGMSRPFLSEPDLVSRYEKEYQETE